VIHFELTRRGDVPVEGVRRAILDAQRRAVALLLNEVAKNVSGRVVQARRGRLRAGLMATIIQRPGETVGTVGFDKRVGYIARFLERGTKPHELGKGARAGRQAYRRRRAQRSRGAFSGRRSTILTFTVGGTRLFRRNAFHPGLRPRPILESALQAAEPIIRADFETALGEALNG
jgi:hypothetical protein